MAALLLETNKRRLKAMVHLLGVSFCAKNLGLGHKFVYHFIGVNYYFKRFAVISTSVSRRYLTLYSGLSLKAAGPMGYKQNLRLCDGVPFLPLCYHHENNAWTSNCPREGVRDM